MALVYFDKFMERKGVRNFGDDINPALTSKFINKDILSSDEIVLFGIGTILNDKNIKDNNHYARKVIFSSGVGYGKLETKLDDTWDIACVRGPGSARALGIDPDRAIADGAILLSELYNKPSRQRARAVFIPHVHSHLSTGRLLAAIAENLGMDYLSPSCNADEFVHTVGSAPFIVTEAMHGAILADTMRVPWVPIGLHEHLEFKWRDWMDSMELEHGSVNLLHPRCWDDAIETGSVSFLRRLYRGAKADLLARKIKQVVAVKEPLLSRIEVIDRKKQELLKVINRINSTY